jgi:predicted esterase
MIREHHLPVTRTARYHTLGLAAAGAPRQLWIVCHGYGQLAARFLRHFETIDDGTRLIVAPEGLSRFYLGNDEGSHVDAKVGATWMTREDRLSEIDDYIRYLDALYAQLAQDHDLSHARVIALGFSQGVATVCRWVERGHARVDEVVLWAGSVPPDMDLARPAHPLRALRPIAVVGDADEFSPPAAVAEHERLMRDKGIDFETLRFPGGHRLDYDTLRALAARWD